MLAGLDHLAGLITDATPDRWLYIDPTRIRVGHRDGSPLTAPPVLALTTDVELILSLRNSADAVLHGRRRIIERHAPHPTREHYLDRNGPRTGPACSGCDSTWPCVEYSDAAADLLPNDQETRS